MIYDTTNATANVNEKGNKQESGVADKTRGEPACVLFREGGEV